MPSTVVAMDRDARIRRLPLALAIGLRLHEAGAADTLIAAGLGIEPEGVPPMLELAQAKLSPAGSRPPGRRPRQGLTRAAHAPAGDSRAGDGLPRRPPDRQSGPLRRIPSQPSRDGTTWSEAGLRRSLAGAGPAGRSPAADLSGREPLDGRRWYAAAHPVEQHPASRNDPGDPCLHQLVSTECPDLNGQHLRGRGGSVQRLALREARRAAGLIVADAHRRLRVGRRSFADN